MLWGRAWPQVLSADVACLMVCVAGSCSPGWVHGDSAGRPVSVEVGMGL